MSDDRLFDVFQTLNQRLVPEPDYADRLLDTLLAEAGLGPTGRATRGWRFWRAGPARMEIPAPGLRIALLLLVLIALVSVTVAVVGTFIRLREGFVETRVQVADIPASAGWSLDTLASEGDVGGQPAVGYGPDGVPVVAYYDNDGERVVVARCTDVACSSLGPVIDAGGVVTNLAEAFGYIAVGPAGETWVARTIPGADGDLGRIEVQRVCPEPAATCEPFAATDLGPGIRPLIRVRADGRPVVLFGSVGNDASPDTSRLVVCGDPACQGGNQTTTVPVSPSMRDFVLTSSGLPLFVTSSNEATTLVSCLDDACTRTSTTLLGPGRQPRFAQDAQERPVIVAFAGRSVVLYRCADAGCSGGTWSSLADLGPAPSGGDELLSLDLLVTPDDRPLVSVSAGGELLLIACSTSACRDATKVTLDSTSPAWAAPHALGINGDGHLPFVVYSVRSDLKVARCLVPECLTPNVASSGPSVSAAASPGASQPSGLVRRRIESGTDKFDPAVVIGADGLPVAAYSSGGELRVVHCGDIRCEAGNTTTTVGTAIVQAIALGPDGYPALGFITEGNSLSVARCQDAACSHPSIAPVREGADWSQYVAIVVPSDDRPIVAFADSQVRVTLARCADPSCTAAQEVVIDPNPGAWWVNSLELRLGSDGLPVLGYALTSQEVKIARCPDLACTSPTVTTVGTDTGDLVTSALEIGADGIPVMAYYSDGSLLFARCDDLACATVTSNRVDDATAGWWTPIGVGISQQGLPVIAYFSPTNRDTKIALCADVSCADAELIPVEASDAKGNSEETGITFLPDGSPIFIYVRAGLLAEVCADPRCGG